MSLLHFSSFLTLSKFCVSSSRSRDLHICGSMCVQCGPSDRLIFHSGRMGLYCLKGNVCTQKHTHARVWVLSTLDNTDEQEDKDRRECCPEGQPAHKYTLNMTSYLMEWHKLNSSACCICYTKLVFASFSIFKSC